MDYQNQFLNNLRKKIKNEKNVNSCLWKFSYSHMKLTISLFNKENIEEKKNLDIVKKKMTTPIFVLLMNENFKNETNIKYVNGELWITWERERDREHPHGQVKIFCSGGGISNGTDEAGSVFFLNKNLAVNTVFFLF